MPQMTLDVFIRFRFALGVTQGRERMIFQELQRGTSEDNLSHYSSRNELNGT